MNVIWRVLVLTALLLPVSLKKSNAQFITIDSLSKNFGTVLENITLYGSGFGNAPANLHVTFGAAEARDIVSVTDRKLVVQVPAGATNSSVSVTNLSSGYTAYSSETFSLSYDGRNFSTNALEPEYKFSTGGFDLNNLCTCDFNLDGLNDVATSDTQGDEVAIFQNTTANTDTVSFDRLFIEIDMESRYVRCGDLDGDGLPDLVFTPSTNNVGRTGEFVIVRNTSTPGGDITFADNEVTPVMKYSIPADNISRLAIRDLNKDGKPEIVVVDFSDRDGAVSIFENTSSPGTIEFNPVAFEPFPELGLPNASLGSIDVADLNKDGYPEVIAGRDEKSDIFVLENSANGSISFNRAIQVNAPGSTTNLRAADMNNDGFPEIIVATITHVALIENASVADSAVAFAPEVRFDRNAEGREGMDIADLNGDSQPDILIGTISSQRRISALLNNSDSTGLDFSLKRTIRTDEVNISVRGADVNGDGKPDILYTGTDSNVISVLLNRNCIVPVLEPVNGLSVCDTLPFPLEATGAIGVTYEWEQSPDEQDFTPVSNADSFVYVTSVENYYRVTVTETSDFFACGNTSNPVKIIRPTGFVPDQPVIINPNPEEPICFNGQLTIETEAVNANYIWTNPQGNIIEGVSERILQLDSIGPEDAGTYEVFVQANPDQGGCESEPAFTDIKVSMPEEITLDAVGSPVILPGGSVEFQVANVDGSTYQWQRNQQDISNTNSPSLEVTNAGIYRSSIINSDGCQRFSNELEVALADIAVPEQECSNETVVFSVAPESLNGERVRYNWLFGDSNSAEGNSVLHDYSSGSEYTVTLEVFDDNNQVADTYEQPVNVIQVPDVEITRPEAVNLCPDSSVLLSTPNGFATYVWTGGTETRDLRVREAGAYGVTITTHENCTVSSEVMVENGIVPVAEVATPDLDLELGDTVQIAASGGTGYEWSPNIRISNRFAPDPLVSPILSGQYHVRVFSTDGCYDTATVRINVTRTLQVNATDLFTPNNDGRRDTWTIGRIELFQDCTVTIYDRRGNRVYEALPYDNGNGWDGTNNGGNPVPPGVYYYVISCSEDIGRAAGSVTVVR